MMTVDVVRVNGLLPQHIGRLMRRRILLTAVWAKRFARYRSMRIAG